MSFGKLLYLKAEGMLMRESMSVSTEYTARVVQIGVRQGGAVQKGLEIGLLHSQEVTDSVARVTADIAKIQLSVTEMRVKGEALAQALPIARRRADASENARAEIESLKEHGLLTATARARVVNDAYETYDEVRELESERAIIARELPQLESTLANARGNVDRLRTSYDDGRLIAPIDGTVAELLVEPGAVVRSGQPILRVLHGEAFVLAYVPTGTLYTVAPGDSVSLRVGFRVLTGRISAMLPIASQLPAEFQKAFQTAQREQVVRIAVDPGQDLPPLFTTLEISRPNNPRVLILAGVRYAAGLLSSTIQLVSSGISGTEHGGPAMQ
ncbi:HlyD family secretion protein [Microvirga roseola]|uniref:HlyD family secretion protein n=1 Tax=Microvirga roseola TaxID=2883126 RepID=UPI001E506459|nr:HlyD family efflux transporter periplasmic adaptor subunit [Microvirga roseola]